MTSTNLLADLKDFAGIVQANAALAPYSQLKIGGPAEVLVQPQRASTS